MIPRNIIMGIKKIDMCWGKSRKAIKSINQEVTTMDHWSLTPLGIRQAVQNVLRTINLTQRGSWHLSLATVKWSLFWNVVPDGRSFLHGYLISRQCNNMIYDGRLGPQGISSASGGTGGWRPAIRAVRDQALVENLDPEARVALPGWQYSVYIIA